MKLTTRELRTARAATSPPPSTPAGTSRVRTRRRGGGFTCRTCGATFTAWAPAERHADTHTYPWGAHGARLEWEDRCATAPNAVTPSAKPTAAGST